MTTELPRLTTAQAASRLGVKPATLYAYVSRGLIESSRDESGGSTFDALAVEALASGRQRSTVAREASGRPLMVLESDLTLIENDDLYFRGMRAVELSRTASFEDATSMLWENAPLGTDEFATDDNVVAHALAAAQLLGPSTRLVDHLGLAVRVAGSFDALRGDLDRDAVFAAGRRIIATMVDALPAAPASSRPAGKIAKRAWAALSPATPTDADIAVVNAALVLCMDHDLASSTLAARVAATARADPYSVVLGALGAFDSPFHGAASIGAARMLRDAIDHGRPERAIANQVAAGRGIPGFGSVVYRGSDPRATELMHRLRSIARYSDAVAAAERIEAIVRARTSRPPSVDLALAVIAVGGEMSEDAGQVLFAIGRTAGWIAHASDEYSRPPLRLRPEARYVGPRPEFN